MLIPTYIFQITTNRRTWTTIHTSTSATDTNGLVAKFTTNRGDNIALKIVREYNKNQTDLVEFDLAEEHTKFISNSRHEADRLHALEEKMAYEPNNTHNIYLLQAIKNMDKRTSTITDSDTVKTRGRKSKNIINMKSDNSTVTSTPIGDIISGEALKSFRDNSQENNPENKSSNQDSNSSNYDWENNDIFDEEFCPPMLLGLSNIYMDRVENYDTVSKANRDEDWVFRIDCGDRELNQVFANRCVEFGELYGLLVIIKGKRGRGTAKWVIVGKTEIQLDRRFDLI